MVRGMRPGDHLEALVKDDYRYSESIGGIHGVGHAADRYKLS